MTGRRGPYSELTSPVLVGALTMLITVVAVFLSYNANQGLPFVPTYDVSVALPDAQELVNGNEVLVGGHRVGSVKSIEAKLDDEGEERAQIDLKLDYALKDQVRTDAKVTVRPRSPLGLKYIQLEPGREGRLLKEGETLSISRAQPVVDLDEVVTELDAPTRANLQNVVKEAGTGFAGRGLALNRAIERLNPLLRDVQPVLHDLADRKTRLGALVRNFARTVGEVAPASAQLASLVADGEVTLAALEAAGPELEGAIARAPGTFAVGTSSLGTLRPVLTKARIQTEQIAPGIHLLPDTTNKVARAVERGTPVLRRGARLGRDLRAALRELRHLTADARTLPTLKRLSGTLRTARPLVDFLVPYQTVCNYLGISSRNLPSAISEGSANGNWLRFDVIGQPSEASQSAQPAPDLHYNPYPNGAAPGQTQECEGGNEPYLSGRQIGNVPGNQGLSTELTDPSGR